MNQSTTLAYGLVSPDILQAVVLTSLHLALGLPRHSLSDPLIPTMSGADEDREARLQQTIADLFDHDDEDDDTFEPATEHEGDSDVDDYTGSSLLCIIYISMSLTGYRCP